MSQAEQTSPAVEAPFSLRPDDGDEGPLFEQHEAIALVPLFEQHEAIALVPLLEQLRDNKSHDPWLANLVQRLIYIVDE